MLSKAKIKYIQSLKIKKKRREERAFVAEGPKLVDDLLRNFSCDLLLASREWIIAHPETRADEIIEVSHEELAKASFQKTPQEVLAVFGQKEYTWDASLPSRALCLALDDIQDPGNLGTIIRLADWFGIEHICCSSNTVDVYNPKTVQASMGGLARVKLYYGSLIEFVSSLSNVPVYGTFLNGENIYQQPLSENGLIIMGNEGNGISHNLEKLVTKRLYIPNFPLGHETSESLNVAVATAIVCAEFRRQVLCL